MRYRTTWIRVVDGEDVHYGPGYFDETGELHPGVPGEPEPEQPSEPATDETEGADHGAEG